MGRSKRSRNAKKKSRKAASKVVALNGGGASCLREREQDRVSDLIMEARGSRGAKRAVLVKQILEIDPDAIVAYQLMGDDLSDVDEASEWYEKGIQVGWRIYKRDDWKAFGDALWVCHEARPFLICMCALADLSWRCDKRQKAFDIFQEYLSLCAFDNVGARFEFLSYYLTAGNFLESEALLNRFKDDVSLSSYYSRALLSFATKGVCPETQAFLAKALCYNPWVAKILLGATPMPRKLPPSYLLQSKGEAVVYCESARDAWCSIPNAIEWLSKQSGIDLPDLGKTKGQISKIPKNLAPVIDSNETFEVWSELYQVAYYLAQRKPWELVLDERPFAVENPYTDEMAICVLTGMLGVSRSLTIYFSEAGWQAGVMASAMAGNGFDAAEMSANMDCLLLEFAAWSELEVMDKRLLKALPGEWSRIKLYPMFRSFRPGFLPYHLDRLEAKFATGALAITQSFVELPENQQFNEQGIVAFHLRKEIKKEMAREKEQWRRLRNLLPKNGPVSDFTVRKLAQVKECPRNEQVSWELDWFYDLSGLRDDRFSRPLAVQTVVIADRNSRCIVNVQVVAPDISCIEQAVQLLCSTIRKVGCRPRVLYLRRAELVESLTPLLADCGIRITVAKQLFAVEEFQQAWIAHSRKS